MEYDGEANKDRREALAEVRGGSGVVGFGVPAEMGWWYAVWTEAGVAAPAPAPEPAMEGTTEMIESEEMVCGPRAGRRAADEVAVSSPLSSPSVSSS